MLCFQSSANGYVTVWSHDAEGNVPARIYPNEFVAETAGERAGAVTAGEETCIGDDDGFRLEVGQPLGEASVYLHYTQREELQFDETAFPQIRLSAPFSAARSETVQLQSRQIETNFGFPGACAVLTGWGGTEARGRQAARALPDRLRSEGHWWCRVAHGMDT